MFAFIIVFVIVVVTVTLIMFVKSSQYGKMLSVFPGKMLSVFPWKNVICVCISESIQVGKLVYYEGSKFP